MRSGSLSNRQRLAWEQQLLSDHYLKTVQAPQPEGRSPHWPRPGEFHLRKTLHQIQERHLALQARELAADAEVRTRTEGQMLIVQPFQIQLVWVFESFGIAVRCAEHA